MNRFGDTINGQLAVKSGNIYLNKELDADTYPFGYVGFSSGPNGYQVILSAQVGAQTKGILGVDANGPFYYRMANGSDASHAIWHSENLPMPIPTSQGGTGADNATGALVNLGGVSIADFQTTLVSKTDRFLPSIQSLPIANTTENESVYYKNQFGEVTVNICVKFSVPIASVPPNGYVYITTLPIGFRPVGMDAHTACILHSATKGDGVGHAAIGADGNIGCFVKGGAYNATDLDFFGCHFNFISGI